VEHVREQAAKRGEAPNIPQKPDIGYRAVNALVAHDEPVVIPRDATEKVHYEGELVVVIGRKAKHLSEAEALSCVLGYTIGNDVSERVRQRIDMIERTFRASVCCAIRWHGKGRTASHALGARLPPSAPELRRP
jgi:2-keto-4-pentenoate hydratase/2-oxohepta-3-ene-1,7-dioic acid hydratase in catechol pathway